MSNDIKMCVALLLAVIMLSALGCNGSVETEQPEEPEAIRGVVDGEGESDSDIKEVDGKSKIEEAIRSRIDDGDYTSAKLDRITINEDYGTDTSDDYIALVYFHFDIKNTRETANQVMRMYSDDLVATLANQGITEISEAAIFWKDKYNDRDVKYAYEYKNGGFHMTEALGE